MLLGALALLRFSTLGAYPLLDTTEGRYAEIAREMIATGDWIVPRLEPDQPFWGKPPLSFWLTAISFKVFGLNEFAARFPSFALAAFAAWMTFLAAARLFGTTTGYLSVLILASMALFQVLAGGVLTDPSLAACLAATMAALALTLKASPEDRSARTGWGLAFFASLGLALLAKGPVGLVIAGAALGTWALWQGKIREILQALPWFWGLLLAGAIAVPWHFAAEAQSPGFLHYYIVGEHFMRFIFPEWEGDLYGSPHDQVRGMIWAFWLGAALPWSPMLLGALLWLRAQGPQEKLATTLKRIDPWTAYFVCWALAPCIFFTLSRNIMLTYVLPGLPGLAIVMARTLEACWARAAASEKPVTKFASPRVWGGALVVAPAIFFIVAVAVLPNVGRKKSQREMVALFKGLDAKDLDAQGVAELVYFDDIEHSGDFYSHGRACDIPDENARMLRRQFFDGSLDYFVVEDDDLEAFQEATPPHIALAEVGQTRKHILFRELAPHRLRPLRAE